MKRTKFLEKKLTENTLSGSLSTDCFLLTELTMQFRESSHNKMVWIGWILFALLKVKSWTGILFPKLFWPTVRKNCSSDRETLLKFEAKGWKFANFEITKVHYFSENSCAILSSFKTVVIFNQQKSKTKSADVLLKKWITLRKLK